MAGEGPTKYEQIAGDLRAAMRRGDYLPGDRLPSKAELMAQYSVAVGTVNDAHRVLRDEGLLRTERGKGTFACEPPPEGPSEYEVLTGQLAEIREEVRLLTERLGVVERALPAGPQ